MEMRLLALDGWMLAFGLQPKVIVLACLASVCSVVCMYVYVDVCAMYCMMEGWGKEWAQYK